MKTLFTIIATIFLSLCLYGQRQISDLPPFSSNVTPEVLDLGMVVTNESEHTRSIKISGDDVDLTIAVEPSKSFYFMYRSSYDSNELFNLKIRPNGTHGDYVIYSGSTIHLSIIGDMFTSIVTDTTLLPIEKSEHFPTQTLLVKGMKPGVIFTADLL